jgi:hypothetical protein
MAGVEAIPRAIWRQPRAPITRNNPIAPDCPLSDDALRACGGIIVRSGVLAALAALILAGCASSTGILPAGPDTYTMSEKFAPIRGGGDEAERDTLTKADKYCADTGRVFVPNNMGQNNVANNPYGPTGYTLTFRCLLPNDPAVANYRLQQAPNVIVEQRNR